MEYERFYAHSAPDNGEAEALAEHLSRVAESAARFAASFGSASEGRAAGLLHDLGKYSNLFTRRLKGLERGLDHWSIGAWVALQRYQASGVATALVAEGHHIGLQRGDGESLRALDPRRLAKRHPRNLQLTECDHGLLLGRLEADGLQLPALERSLADDQGPQLPWMLDVRMLFSCLVDADFLETEAHFHRGELGQRRYRESGPELQAADALGRVSRRVEELARSRCADERVMSQRAEVFADCLAASDGAPGLFTLTAPTGSGKTLAMLAFALKHARENRMRRVVLALPFLTIAEQTARIYRELFEAAYGKTYLIESHSLAGMSAPSGGGEANSGVERVQRLLAENWDAPLVLTTNVQLLESLFANRPSACRKLHRLAGSVVLLDETQTLPPHLAVPTLAALSHLSQRYRSTVVFATATQPAFKHLHKQVEKLCSAGWQPSEIIRQPECLFRRVKRYRPEWRIAKPIAWSELAGEIAAEQRGLVIVNLKRHARDLTAALAKRCAEGDVFHLSTNLCPSHRESMLREVRDRLKAGSQRRCLLIATQCVEAGVDLDFPVVWRALAPLEAIAQAAGRANRNGRLTDGGMVHVFLPEDEGYPPGGYEQATDVTRGLFAERGPEGMDLNSPSLFRDYFQRLYDLTKVTDRWEELRRAITARDFVATAELYRLIGKEAIEILVPYDPDEFRRLRRELLATGRLTQPWIRRARRHAVSVFRPKPDDPLWQVLEPAPLGRGESSDEWFLLLQEKAYDRSLLGLLAAEAQWIA